MTTSVYVLRSIENEVLYVGISVNVYQRLDQHRAEKPWWYEVSSIGLTHYDERSDALDAEAALIQTLRPRYNRSLKPSAPHVGILATPGRGRGAALAAPVVPPPPSVPAPAQVLDDGDEEDEPWHGPLQGVAESESDALRQALVSAQVFTGRADVVLRDQEGVEWTMEKIDALAAEEALAEAQPIEVPDDELCDGVCVPASVIDPAYPGGVVAFPHKQCPMHGTNISPGTTVITLDREEDRQRAAEGYYRGRPHDAEEWAPPVSPLRGNEETP